MLEHYSKIKTPGKSLLLTAIYALHLLFFQALLASPGNISINGNFNPLFSSSTHQQLPINHNHKTGHPASTYYNQLSRQGSASMHSETESPDVFVHTIKIATLQIISGQQFAQLPYIAFHESDNSFERYRLINVFLI